MNLGGGGDLGQGAAVRIAAAVRVDNVEKAGVDLGQVAGERMILKRCH